MLNAPSSGIRATENNSYIYIYSLSLLLAVRCWTQHTDITLTPKNLASTIIHSAVFSRLQLQPFWFFRPLCPFVLLLLTGLQTLQVLFHPGSHLQNFKTWICDPVAHSLFSRAYRCQNLYPAFLTRRNLTQNTLCYVHWLSHCLCGWGQNPGPLIFTSKYA